MDLAHLKASLWAAALGALELGVADEVHISAELLLLLTGGHRPLRGAAQVAAEPVNLVVIRVGQHLVLGGVLVLFGVEGHPADALFQAHLDQKHHILDFSNYLAF